MPTDAAGESFAPNGVKTPPNELPIAGGNISKIYTDLPKKPWQKNMKKPIITPIVLVESTNNNAKEKPIKTIENAIQDNNIPTKKSQSKPWRSHMKKTLAENQNNKEANGKGRCGLCVKNCSIFVLVGSGKIFRLAFQSSLKLSIF